MSGENDRRPFHRREIPPPFTLCPKNSLFSIVVHTAGRKMKIHRRVGGPESPAGEPRAPR